MSSSRLRQPIDEQHGRLTSLVMQEIVAGEERILRLKGDFDLLAAPLLEETLRRACVGSPGSAFVLDLSGVSFIDSSGLRAVVLAGNLCAEAGCEFRLVPGPRQVQRAFEASGLDAVLPFRPDAGR